jgi:ADP-heptose:LPS heptosyltransferase
MAEWVEATFEVAGARPYIAPAMPDGPPSDITVSLGVGGNLNKRIRGPFERRLMEILAATGRSILIDAGAGGEEAERVARAIAGLANVLTWQGAFAPFAAEIARSKLYVGYDSAGQHVAAACGTPLLTIFAGFPNERFFERWRPKASAQVAVIRADSPDPDEVLAAVRLALARLGF